MPKTIIATLDTETASLSGDVYDVAWIIHDKKGEILAKYAALVLEVFTKPKKMMGAFYAAKVFTHYAPMLDRGEIALVPFADIAQKMRDDFDRHNVTVIAAYHIGFDLRALAKTSQELLGARTLYKSYRILDIWQFMCEARLNTDKYREIARSLGWVSEAGNIRTNAEFAYRYESGDFNFIEDHTALSDCEIEVKLLAKCFAQKRKIPYGIKDAHPWRIIQRD